MADLLDLNLEDVVAAGRVLFGPAFRADGQGWRVELKTTYRRRALETHPDRARATGRSESDLSREFRRVSEAYRVLSQLAGGPVPPPARGTAAASGPPPCARRPPGPEARGATAPTPPPAGEAPPAGAGGARSRDVPGGRARRDAAREALPRRRLRLAEYLYYTGRVPWTAFVEAISWQRGQRPPVGRIAVEWGFLEPEDVSRILEERRVREAGKVPFGEFAVRLGYLTSFQVLAVLGRQLRGQRRIGEFFVERGLLEPDELDEIRRRMARHNAQWRE
jgi:hypothetical protein